jgi:hypothetical protein
MDTLYEIVDASSDEQYWTLAFFKTIDEAWAELNACTPEDFEDHGGDCQLFRAEVREHKWGFGGNAKCVHAVEWARYYDEQEDEYKWRRLDAKPETTP